MNKPSQTGEVDVSMRPVSVFANPSAPAYQHLHQLLHHRWRQAARVVMVLLSASGMSAAEIGEALGYHLATVRRWIHRYHADGPAGLTDRMGAENPIHRCGLQVLRYG